MARAWGGGCQFVFQELRMLSAQTGQRPPGDAIPLWPVPSTGRAAALPKGTRAEARPQGGDRALGCRTRGDGVFPTPTPRTGL